MDEDDTADARSPLRGLASRVDVYFDGGGLQLGDNAESSSTYLKDRVDRGCLASHGPQRWPGNRVYQTQSPS